MVMAHSANKPALVSLFSPMAEGSLSLLRLQSEVSHAALPTLHLHLPLHLSSLEETVPGTRTYPPTSWEVGPGDLQGEVSEGQPDA